jgi:nitroimidazol reductase NimA-like FMN-containing flavoprotein (pyridoxamine 5'-phosphate oxidase superfamily)
MYREIRRQERVLDESRIHELLLVEEYGVLSTTSIDGCAYGIPMNYVFDNETIYFHCAFEGHKVDNITAYPLVSFCIVGNTKVSPSEFTTFYESVVVFGIIEKVNDDAEKSKALHLIVSKYSPGYEVEGNAYIERAIHKTKVLKLKIKRITGKGRLL